MATIQDAQKGNEHFDKFIEENLNLVHAIVRKYDSAGEYDDYFQSGCIGLFKAAKTFNPDKGVKFSTYAYRIIDTEILVYYRKKKKHSNTVSLESAILQDESGGELTLLDILESKQNIESECLNEIELTEKYKKLLLQISDKYTEVLRLYLKGITQRKISSILGFSQSYVSRIINRFYEIGTQIDCAYQTGESISINRVGKEKKEAI